MTDTKALLEEIKREYALRSEIVRNGPRLKELVYSVYGANLCFKHVPECDALIAVTAGSYVVMWDARDYHILDAQLLLVPFTIVPSVACFISTSAAMLEFAVVSKQGTCITYRMHFKGSAFCASAPPLPSFAPPTSAKLPSGFNVDLNNSRAATPEPSNPDAPQKTLTEDLRDNQFKEPPAMSCCFPNAISSRGWKSSRFAKVSPSTSPQARTPCVCARASRRPARPLQRGRPMETIPSAQMRLHCYSPLRRCRASRSPTVGSPSPSYPSGWCCVRNTHLCHICVMQVLSEGHTLRGVGRFTDAISVPEHTPGLFLVPGARVSLRPLEPSVCICSLIPT